MKILTLQEWKDYYIKNNRFYDNSYINLNKKYSNKDIEKRFIKYFNKIQKHITKQRQKKEKYENEFFDQHLEELTKRMDAQFNNEEIIDDPIWHNLLKEIKIRDNNQCRLLAILTKEEKKIFFKNVSDFFLQRLEGAHCISRAKSKSLYYEKKNIYLLNCYSHRNLDEFRCPLTGTPLKKEEIKKWWIRIVGLRIYNWLEINK